MSNLSRMLRVTSLTCRHDTGCLEHLCDKLCALDIAINKGFCSADMYADVKVRITG
jgi:hypothetical protein